MTRGALLLAVLAALLLGAPSAVLAAPPNRLEAATANPTAGTPLTPFDLSVRYVSGAGNAASGVTARIGPLDVPLRLSAGTATDGTWSGSSLLPVGTWSLTYHATADRGPSPSLAGPTLTVLGGASPSPDGRPGGDETAPTSSGGADAHDPSSGPSVSPAAGPKAPDKPKPGSRTPLPDPHGGGSGDDGGNGDDGGAVADDTPEPAAESGTRASGEGRRRGGAAPVHRTPVASAPAAGAPVDGDPAPSDRGQLLLLLGAIVAVATIALLGTGWLLASREREDEVPTKAVPSDAGATAAAAARRRRARATAAVLPGDDPVLAALGLDEKEGGPRDPLRGAARGAAPRPPKAPRAPR